MKRIPLFAIGSLFALIARADEPTDAGTDEAPAATENDVGDTISAHPPQAVRHRTVQIEGHSEWLRELSGYEGREYPAIVYLGARVLGAQPEFVQDCRHGLELLYQRDYSGSKSWFDSLGNKWQGTAISPVGQILIWQALMLENFDFRYESQYLNSYRRARQELEQAMVMPGNDAWENFIMAGILGIDAIHVMRHEEYLTALNRGYEAMKFVAKAKELAPEFRDAVLGDGLFDYWVTVISKSSKVLPDIGDRREKGIREMTSVEQEGIFLGPPATLGLTFTWIEEGKKREALRSAMKNHHAYPDNIINNQVLGRVYMYNRRYVESEQTFHHVLETDPKNLRAHFYLGRLYLRWKKPHQALESLDTYLAFPDISDLDRGIALYYKGNAFWRLKDWEQAEAAYKSAWKTGKIKRAKTRMERVKEKRSQG